MKKELLGYICCPSCRSPLELEGAVEEGAEIVSGSLLCRACGGIYAVEGGVPNLLLKQKLGDEKIMSRGFEFEWKYFFRTSKPYFKQMFLEWVAPLKDDDFSERVILDAGCGMGRNSLIAASMGAKAVIAFDIHDAVKLFYGRSKAVKNPHIVKADIFNPPFKRVFDIVYSAGVLHHTPSPSLAFKKLSELVNPGGVFSSFVYGRENNSFIAKVVSFFRESVISRMPNLFVLLLSYVLGFLLFIFLKFVFTPVNYVFKLAGTGNFAGYFRFLAGTDFEYSVHVVFDHLVTPIASYHANSEVESWYRDNGFSDVKVWNRYGITHIGFGRKK